jgi:exodeoxyribonuclease V beta subunit
MPPSTPGSSSGVGPGSDKLPVSRRAQEPEPNLAFAPESEADSDSVPSPTRAELSGINLIEASAGTGKTRAITDLYERLVLERECGVSDILVVTYTKAATAELRERIRARLGHTARALRQGDYDGPASTFLTNEGIPFEAAARRIESAMQGFDQAAIYTIHGYCQRALSDTAFEGAQPFSSELVVDDGVVVDTIVRDYWRSLTRSLSPLELNAQLAHGMAPEELLAWVRRYVSRSHLQVRVPAAGRAIAELVQVYENNFDTARTMWASHREQVGVLLHDAENLNQRTYSPKAVDATLDALGFYFRDEAGPAPATDGVLKSLRYVCTQALANGTKKGKSTPQHGFFDVAQALRDAALAVLDGHLQMRAQIRADLLEFVRSELLKRGRETRTRTFDELLLGLDRALSGEGGAVLAKTLRQRYPYALVDEFQDTDPVQLAILRAIYVGHESTASVTGGALFLVGDPKQAIYGFRGADVFAYLEGRADADSHFTLGVNYRSSPALVEAVNALFSRMPQPFALSGIDFAPVGAGRDKAAPALTIAGQSPAPFQWWTLGEDERGKVWAKPRARERVAQASAQAITALLGAAARGDAHIGEAPLAGGDIAVVVRTNAQGELIQRALSNVGVRSVHTGQSNVYASDEARYIAWLLDAVCNPRREPRIRGVLLSPLFGHSANDLVAWADDGAQWDEIIGRFHHWHQLWHEHGFNVMFRRVLEDSAVATRLLSQPFGERQLTNVLHVGELLQGAELDLHAAPDELLRWFRERRDSSNTRDEATEQRLESDEDLVRIVTVHKSKGLQYPVVFCPFAWDEGTGGGKKDGLEFHDPDEGGAAVLDLAHERDPRAISAERSESLSEAARLVYVALTRAEHRCYVVWGHLSGAPGSALGWLLRTQADATPKNFQEKQWANYEAVLRELASAHPDAFDIVELPLAQHSGVAQAGEPAPELNARSFRASVAVRWKISSFTSLTAGLSADLPDHDHVHDELSPDVFPDAFPDASPQAPTAVSGAMLRESSSEAFLDATEYVVRGSASSRSDADSASTLPRGARAGACIHAVFERLDFERLACEQSEVVSEALREYGFADDAVGEVTALVERVRTCRLLPSGDLRLSSISPNASVKELEFHFPVGAVSLDRVLSVAQRHGYLGALGHSRDGQSLAGYLKGYVDLIFEAQGQYYVVDYKSHWLGPAGSDYHQAAVQDVVQRDGYELQYLLYTVALHRYLTYRLAGYDYDTHVGGVLYLFIRGMGLVAPGNGVFFDRPSKAAIDALSDVLMSRESSIDA